MELPLINTRADLDSLVGTRAHTDFIALLKGSMTQRKNTAIYPDGYGQSGYVGPAVEPVWMDSEDLSTIERFGFSKDQILAL